MVTKSISITLLVGCLLYFGCKPKIQNSNGSVFQEISPRQSGISFNNNIKEDVDFHHLNWESVYNGAGVATADFNNDGLLDIYFTGNQVNDAIYENLGNFRFEDRSTSSGIEMPGTWSTGVSIADVNQDGLLDIYVCKMWHAADGIDDAQRKNALFINQGAFKFQEQAASYGLDDIGNGTQASFFDYDRDGDLDLYILNAPSNNYDQKLSYIQANKIPYMHSDKLLRNDNGTFTDVTKISGVEDYGFGLGLLTVDLNNDGWTDIYVANDFEIADRMFINQKDGTFKDLVQQKLKHISFSSMGTDAADINNDGEVDIAVLDMQSADHFRSKTNMPSMDEKRFWTGVSRGQHYQYMSNMLQLNNGYGYYSDIAQLAGIASTDWSWSVLMADYNMDGNKDIFITNGLNKDIRNNDFAQEMLAYRKRGKEELFKFSQKVGSEKIANLLYAGETNALVFNSSAQEWGLDHQGYSYGAAYADLDNDGDLDLVVNNNNEVASLYKNGTKNGDYLHININQNGHPCENAKIYVYEKDKIFFHEQSRIRGFQSSVSPEVLIATSGYDSIKIVHPNGQVARPKNIPLNQKNKLKLSDLEWEGLYTNPLPSFTMIKDITKASKLEFNHQENRFNDFQRESLLPHMQSKNGPWLTHDEKSNLIFIGNAQGAGGKMFQRVKQYYKEVNGPWTSDLQYEDQGAVFFDLEGDGDQDLFVASGDGEHVDGDESLKNRIYINNGNTWKSSEIEGQNYNSSVVISADFDKDGDDDIFIGGHVLAGKYPQSSKSQLLINENGVLVDQTLNMASGLSHVGMVNDAIFTDFNQDEQIDLIVVGEFMNPTFFLNEGNQFSNVTDSYLSQKIPGWYYSIKAVDLDQDGTDEYLLGNIGQNNKYHPTNSKPLKIYGSDFDKNNTNDIVLTKTTEAYGEVPVRGRECSSQQMPFIKSKFKTFEGYAKASVIDIYGESDLEKSINLEAREFSSGYLKWNGKAFDFIQFPDIMQISSIRGFETDDINGDGKLDIICVGNNYEAEIETTRHDSSIGWVAIQNSEGKFEPLTIKESGFYVPGNSRKITKITGVDDTTHYIVTNNGFIAQVFEKNQIVQ